MNDEDFITGVRITNRIDYQDWDTIKKTPMFLEFLRNRVVFCENRNAKDERGNPAFWTVIDWLEENMNDLWYVAGVNIYFYTPEDAMAFKLRWS